VRVSSSTPMNWEVAHEAANHRGNYLGNHRGAAIGFLCQKQRSLRVAHILTHLGSLSEDQFTGTTSRAKQGIASTSKWPLANGRRHMDVLAVS
jgi:hypothetical protein